MRLFDFGTANVGLDGFVSKKQKENFLMGSIKKYENRSKWPKNELSELNVPLVKGW